MPDRAVVPPRPSLPAEHPRLAIAVTVAVAVGIGTLVVTIATATASFASIRQAASPAVPAPVAAPTIPAPTVPATVKPRGVTVTTKSAASSSARSSAATHRVTATAGKGVAVRATPDAAGTLLGRRAEGAALSIRCQVRGTLVRDATQKRSSALWDRLAGGGYVANVYTTAYDPATAGYSRGLKACTGSTSTATASSVRATATTIARASSARASGTASTTPSAEAISNGRGSVASTTRMSSAGGAIASRAASRA